MKKKAPVRKFDPRKVKYHFSYDTERLAELCNVNIQTIRSWKRKEGLQPIDDKTQPTLFHGSEIRRFLKDKDTRNRMSACAINEMTCFKCKQPRIPLNYAVHYFPQSRKTANLQSICSVCNTVMHKTVSLKNLPEIEKYLRIEQIGEERLKDFQLSPYMTHLTIHGNTRPKFKPQIVDDDGQINMFTYPKSIKEKDI